MKKKILIVAADYYVDISDGLLNNVKKILQEPFDLITVPGIFEIPITIAKNIKKYDGFVALGCVIKGETPHFDFISKAAIDGIMKLSIEHKKPIGNGIITCLNKKQAFARQKKGQEAAAAMSDQLLTRDNPRVVVIQKLYAHHLNKESEITFPKHRYKKFIKDVVNGTIERKELIQNIIDKELKDDINVNRTDLLIKLMIEAAIYEFMYMHKTPVKVVISEYLKASDFFLDSPQKKFLNALLDKISKLSRVDKP
jgi:6,7-dimethyl-8-ribityllumazine synthase